MKGLLLGLASDLLDLFDDLRGENLLQDLIR
jgi:hypothetical protein